MPNYQGERAHLNLEFRNEVQAWRRDYEARTGQRITIGEALEYLAWRGMAVVRS